MDWKVVGNNRLFQGISETELKRMLGCAKFNYKKYHKGDVIFRQDESVENFYVLLKGQVTIAKHLISGKKNILYIVRENQIFGEEQTFQYGAWALSDVELIEMPKTFFYSFCSNACKHHKQLIQNILEMLSMKEWLVVKKINIVSAVSLKERISIWMLEEADDQGVVQVEMNREELADYLGVARPSLSRTLMQMQSEGTIEVEKKQIRILDIKKIRTLCN
nr:Crp/Fnr family transcriptional regulator [Frisingicoccus sp.]